MDSIEKQFQAGIDKAMAIRDKAYMIWLTTLCYRLIHAAERHAGYNNLTGNTITSLMCGIYNHGKLIKIVNAADMPAPIREKLDRGDILEAGTTTYDGWVLKEDYAGTVDTSAGYGEDFSRQFLASFIPQNAGYSVVMCTGTEYSVYLQTAKHMDVLTKTFNDADNLINGLI